MKRIHSLDSLKLLAIMAIFVIHYGVFYNFQGTEKNTLYLSLNIIARFAVPVFFVIAGFLFFQRTQTKALVTYTRNYVIKLFFMYLVWTFIYYAVIGLGMLTWRPISLEGALYYGTLGSEILWFLPALFYSIIVLAVAVYFNKSSWLFTVAIVLHLIGLANQSYQPLMPEWLQFVDTNFRDPAFFGLFYVVLGYQLSKENWLAKLVKISNKSLVWLTIVVITGALMIVEGLQLIQQAGGPIGEYYLFTPLLTIALFMVAFTKKNNTQASFFSKIGAHSGELYLNHGVVQFFYGGLLYFYGYYTVPEKMAEMSNSVSWQLLVVPVMLSINVAVYLLLRKMFTGLCGVLAIKQYKDLAMFSGAYWVVFFIAGTAQGTPLFDSNSSTVLASALAIFMFVYMQLAWFINLSQQQVNSLSSNLSGALLLATVWITLAITGGFTWLFSHYIAEGVGTPLDSYLSTPLLYFTLTFLLFVPSTIWILSLLAKVPWFNKSTFIMKQKTAVT